MYGLVNTAIADLTRSVGGEAAWARVCALADVPDATFVGMTAYPDDVTYRLVAAASSVLDLPAEQVLTAFGRHWVQYTAQQGWGPLLQAAGSTPTRHCTGPSPSRPTWPSTARAWTVTTPAGCGCWPTCGRPSTRVSCGCATSPW